MMPPLPVYNLKLKGAYNLVSKMYGDTPISFIIPFWNERPIQSFADHFKQTERLLNDTQSWPSKFAPQLTLYTTQRDAFWELQGEVGMRNVKHEQAYISTPGLHRFTATIPCSTLDDLTATASQLLAITHDPRIIAVRPRDDYRRTEIERKLFDRQACPA